jgi:hypothetical protein
LMFDAILELESLLCFLITGVESETNGSFWLKLNEVDGLTLMLGAAFVRIWMRRMN